VFQPKTKTWTPATLKEQMNQPRSYIVETNSGSELRRNRIQLKPSGQVAPSLEGQLLSNQDNPPQPSAPTFTSHQVPSPGLPQTPQKPATVGEGSAGQHLTTRSGRVVKKPLRLDL